MRKLWLIILGLIPFASGFFMDWAMMQFQDYRFPYKIIGVCFLLFWAFLGLATCKIEKTPLRSAVCVNLPAFLALLLNIYQDAVLLRYWGNLLGTASQLFYLPVLNIAFSFTRWSDRVWTAYVMGFLLMCLAFCLGVRLRRIRTP